MRSAPHAYSDRAADMAQNLPEDPHDPRWLPSLRTAIAIGVGIQLLFVVLGWALVETGRALPARPALVDDVLIPEDLVFGDSDVAPRPGKQSPPVDVGEMAVATSERLAKGEGIYREYCASCHGDGGKGDGPAGVSLDPPPRNMTSTEGWKGGTRLSDIFRTVTLGLEGTQMSGFDYLPVEDRFAVSHHTRSLGSGHDLDTEASLDSLDAAFDLSEGFREPNIIPLQTAMEKIASESPPAPGGLTPEQLDLIARVEVRGAGLYDQVVDPEIADRVATLLTVDSLWVGRPDRLREMAVNGSPTNGFRARANLLSDEDWASLGRYLALRYLVSK